MATAPSARGPRWVRALSRGRSSHREGVSPADGLGAPRDQAARWGGGSGSAMSAAIRTIRARTRAWKRRRCSGQVGETVSNTPPRALGGGVARERGDLRVAGRDEACLPSVGECQQRGGARNRVKH